MLSEAKHLNAEYRRLLLFRQHPIFKILRFAQNDKIQPNAKEV